MTNFYAASNLKHDGREYAAGDQITLDAATAQPLLDAGVIQTDVIAAAVVAVDDATVEQTSADVAQIGGAEQTTGEPALDHTATTTAATTTTVAPVDVTASSQTSAGIDLDGDDDPSANL
jgi:hypothetical protein